MRRPEGDSQVNAPADRKPGFWKSLDWKLMAALFFPVTLETLDYTVVATAQTRIASVFNALPLQSYIGTSYLLASTVFLPSFASIADIYGRHFGLQLSLLFFLVGSALSTGAVNMAMILIGRGIAGIGAAGLLTIVRTMLADATSLEKSNVQQSMLFLLYTFGFSTGPVIGGALVAVNFRWVFAINLPITALAMFMCFVLLQYRSTMHVMHYDNANLASSSHHIPLKIMKTWISKLALIDWVGTFLFVCGGTLILLALNWGPDDNWKSARVIATIIFGKLFMILCIFWEILLEKWSRHEHNHTRTRSLSIFHARPMLPVEMFTSYDMCVVQYDSFITGMVLFVMFYFVAIFATIVTGLPPARAGVQLLYFAPGVGGGSLLSIGMIKVFRQPRQSIVIGCEIMTIGVGFIQMAIQYNKQGQMNGFMSLIGVGVGVSVGPLVTHARFMKPNHIATTNALLLFFTAFGGTVGLAQCFTILNAKVNAYISSQITTLAVLGEFTPFDLIALASLRTRGGLASFTSLDGLPSAIQGIVRDAFQDGVRWAFISLIPWLGVGSLLSMFLSRIQLRGREEEGRGLEAEAGGGARNGMELELGSVKARAAE